MTVVGVAVYVTPKPGDDRKETVVHTALYLVMTM